MSSAGRLERGGGAVQEGKGLCCCMCAGAAESGEGLCWIAYREGKSSEGAPEIEREGERERGLGLGRERASVPHLPGRNYCVDVYYNYLFGYLAANPHSSL